MKKIFILLFLSVIAVFSAQAQRKTDNLDRGLVAVKKASGVFVSWRVQADEYYGVKYNLYCDGSKIAENLEVSNYTDAAGSATSQYSVAAVVNGVEQSQCDVVLPWSNGTGNGPQYMPIKVADVKARNGNVVWKNENGTITKTINYSINDISLGDVDGDGKIDFIVKRINDDDRNALFPVDNTTAFCRIEVYTSKKNYQLAWYIDCGPNTVFGSDEQWDAVAFDWDEDGKCEVLYRAYANTIIHKADGSTVTIGSANENIRAYVTHKANMTFTNCGNEYLVYMNGETGEPYVTMEYPLKRLESSEYSTSIDWSNASDVSSKIEDYLTAESAAWGDSYGHRSSKYFMGAPYLDGRKPSIYLGRGIYTRTKMIAYDVDPATHALTKKWEWNNNTPGSPWYGQGYHNFAIADVDEDGCDEIVYGSMVIDNNGKGLSTTGLGHGDASHTGDFDPFRKGLETFACNEDEPGNNFRNATTCEIYYRNTAASDDGRSMAGNFTNLYPGSVGASTSSGIVSLASDKAIDGITNNWINNTPNPIALNIRIYWDGDLLSETVNGPGKDEGYMFVDKWGERIFDTNHGSYETKCIGDTKKNLNAHGDILGDWREEIVIRKSDDSEFRVYTTTDETQYRIPCLWYDHQYRQGMVWQSEGYNQPPHVSYFMGEMEGLTKVPVPYTMAGRVEITEDGGEIPASANGKDVFVYNKGNVKIPNGGVSPRSLIINTPSSVDGNDGNGIFRVYSETQLGNGSLMGGMNLVKQGDGMLKMEQSTYEYTGNTDVFAGSLYMKGSIPNSPVWMNRHTTLFAAGTFGNDVTMEYGSKLYVNGSLINGSGEVSGYDNSVASIKTLNLHEGSRVILDIDPKLEDEHSSDILNLETLSIRKRDDWQYGPEYLAPVFEFNFKTPLTPGSYPIGTLTSVEGNLEDIILEGNFGRSNDVSLVIKDGTLYLEVVDNGNHFIGKENFTTAFWGDFSDSYTIKEGYSYNFKFTNYGNSAENWYNWILAVVNGSGHGAADRSDYAEYFVLRADNYGWGDYYDGSTLANNYDWDNFKSDMTNADVDMNVKFVDGVVYVDATIKCKSGKSYTYSYHSKEISADEVTVFFTVDNSYMTYPDAEETELEPTNVIPGGEYTIYATLEHTASTTCGGDKSVVTYTLDEENEHYNFEGSGTWQGYAFAKFSYAIPEDVTIKSAKLVWSATSGKGYGTNVYYLNAGRDVDFDAISSGTAGLLRYNGVKTSLVAESSVQNGRYNIETDVTDAVAALASQGYIDFQWTANSGGADLFGKGSVQYAPQLVITYEASSSLTLEPKAVDTYKTGIYETVTVNRTFKAGFSTLCVPFNTTIEEFTGGKDSEAYVAYLSEVEENNGSSVLIFTNGSEIEANKPYIIYLSKDLVAPTVTDKPVFSESPKTVTVGKWSMTGNYTVGKSMYNLYGVAKNSDFMIGGPESTINGLTAYVTGPVNATVKSRIMIEEANGISNANAGDGIVTGIYNVSGAPVKSIQRGINIIRMSDGTSRKVFIK